MQLAEGSTSRRGAEHTMEKGYPDTSWIQHSREGYNDTDPELLRLVELARERYAAGQLKSTATRTRMDQGESDSADERVRGCKNLAAHLNMRLLV